MRKSLLILASMCVLSACSLLPSPGEPTKKYTLETLPKDSADKNLHAKRAAQLIVDLPTLYPPIDNTRIALKPEAQTIDYYADVEWADRLSALIQESVIYSLQNQNVLRGVSRSTDGVNPEYALKIEVRKFYVEPQETTRPATAQVDYMVHLMKMPERRILASKNFTHAQGIPDQTLNHIIQSLNTAHLAIVKALMPWVLSHMR